MPKYSEINIAETKKQLTEHTDTILLDIRDAHSYREEHIEGAMLSHDGLVESLVKKREFDRPVVIYCYHGNSSKDLAEFLGSIGFKHVYSMAGGFVAWKKAMGESEVLN